MEFGTEEGLAGLPQAIGLGGAVAGLPSVESLTAMAKGGLMKSPEEARKERADYVKKWLRRVNDAKSSPKFKRRFEKMKDDMKFVRGLQWPGQSDVDPDGQRYVANITQRHVRQRVAALYAKNPTVVAKRRQTLDFTLWDEDPASLRQAMMTVQMAQQAAPAVLASGQMPPPQIVAEAAQAMALIEEVESVKQRRAMLEKMGRTLEALFNYYLKDQEPNFKIQAKQLIRRVETCGVGYIKLGFQRKMERRPDVSSKLGDLTERLSHLQRLAHEAGEDGVGAESAELEELQLAVESLLSEPQIVVEEGLVFDFPRANAIIFDPKCVNIRGFIGADWIAQQFLFSHEEIEEIYGIDLKGKVTAYYEEGEFGELRSTSANPGANNTDAPVGKVLCYEIYHKPSGQMMTVADGFDDFLTEPAAPRVWLERFWPIYTLTFNDIEDINDPFPDSDVRLLRAMQVEHNRAREGLREHRIANRPGYVGPAGVLEENDKAKLASHEVSELVELNVPIGTDINTVIQPLKKAAIDPAVYDTSPFFDDVMKVVGSQEADFGGVSGVAATEVSVAEGARISTLQSNIDDLDDFLSEIARGASQIMLREVSLETARKIAGPGAVWPQLSAQEVAEELYLEIEAGSSGRPNRAHEIANWERIGPMLMQIPGVNPSWVARKIIRVVDDTVDVTDAFIEGMPSIVALNAMRGNPQPATGDPATDPAQQGDQGNDKTADPQKRQGGPQPSYRQPADNRQ